MSETTWPDGGHKMGIDYRPEKPLLPPPGNLDDNVFLDPWDMVGRGLLGLFMTSYPDFSKIFELSYYMSTKCPKIVYFISFPRKKIPRLWRHERGKIAIFVITRPCHGLIDFPAYMTTRWPKMVLFIIFSWKNIFSHGYDVISVGK